MRKSIFSVLTTLFVAVLVSSLVYAQPGPPPGGDRGRDGGGRQRGQQMAGGFGFGGGLGLRELTTNEKIQEKLKLTEDQKKEMQKLAEEQRGQRGERREGDRPSQEEMEKRMQEFQARQKAAQEKIVKVLTPEQQGTYKELRFQLSGGLESPMLNIDNLEVLNLTEDQKAKLKTLQEEGQKQFREFGEKFRGFRDLPEDQRRKAFDDLRAQGEELRKKHSEKVNAVFTPEQIDKAKKLSEEGKDLRPQRPEGGPRDDRGGDGYRPGADSWRPGQGGQRREGGDRPAARRSFPKSE